MIVSLAYLLTYIVLGITLLHAPRLSGEWLWDLANTLGFLTFAGLLYLFLDVGRGRRQRLHQLFSYGVAVALVGHILLLWADDETLWYYMVWDGPHYMLGGWIAAVFMISMIILALPAGRRFWHLSYQQFQRWHYWLSLGVLLTAWWHMAGSGFYLSTAESGLYALLILATVVAHGRRLAVPSADVKDVILVPLGIVLFVAFKVALG